MLQPAKPLARALEQDFNTAWGSLLAFLQAAASSERTRREPCTWASCLASVGGASVTAGVWALAGAEGLQVEFDRQCSTERRHDPLTVMDGVNRIVSVRSGGGRRGGARPGRGGV